MATRFKLLPIALLALVALLIAACGGSSDNGDAGTSPPARDDSSSSGVSEDSFVSSGADVLGISAERFAAEDVTSAEGEVEFGFTMGTTDITGTATFAYVAPDKMHLTMTFDGGDTQSVIDLGELGNIEMLARDGKFYMNIPFLGGWFVMDPAALGESAQSVEDLISNGSLIDYSGFIDSFGGTVEYVGEEDVDGTNTVHYRVSGTLSDLITSFSDALSATGDDGVTQQILTSELDGPITIDLWVGKDDVLPYKMAAEASLETPEGPFALSLTGRFFGYNDDVEIPPAPADALDFSALFAEMGGETPAP